MRKWLKRLLAIAVGGFLVFLIASRVYEEEQAQSAPKGAGKKGGSRVVTVDLATARSGEVQEVLMLTGALKAKESVDVIAKVTGRLQKVYFQVGDRVSRGDVVAEMEDDELQQRVSRAEAAISVNSATVSQAQAELANTEANLRRSEQLFEEGLLSPQEFEQQKTSLAMVEAQVKLAEAQREQSEAELRELKIQLAQMRIYSPMDGVAAIRYVDEGALVTPSTPIVRIIKLSTMVTHGNVPERNIGKLRVGNEAQVRVDAMPGEVFRGRISRIAPVLDAATRTALIEIDIANPQSVLKAEMFARIELDTGSTREATLISRDALVYRGSQPGVFLLDDNQRPVFRPIETGMTREDDVEVLANLEPGTTVVGRGASMLREGDRVQVAGAKGSRAPEEAAVPPGAKGKAAAQETAERTARSNPT